MSNKILTLIKLQSFDINDYFSFKKILISSKLTKNELLSHFTNSKKIRDVMALYEYQPRYTGEILKDMGYSQGPEMGKKMLQLETESFLKYYEKYLPNWPLKD